MGKGTARHATNALWSADYAYDPVGRRIGTVSSQYADLSYVHAGDMEIAEYDATSGDLLRRYIPGAGVDKKKLHSFYTAHPRESGGLVPPS